MELANVGRVISIVIGVAASACSQPTPVEREREAPPVEQPADPGPPPAAVTDPCHALAQLYCENGPVDCGQIEQMLRVAELPESACAKAVQELEATLASIGPELLPMVLARYLAVVMLESPKLTDEQRAQFEALSRGPSSAEEPADFDPDLVDVVCPGVSRARGEMPPAGVERWCERDDGQRHGRALLWNANGELVRDVEYRDGEAVTVAFRLPESQVLPPETFMCPSGQVERKEGSGESQRRWCETAAGDRSGIEVVWEAGRVVSVGGNGAVRVVHRTH